MKNLNNNGILEMLKAAHETIYDDIDSTILNMDLEIEIKEARLEVLFEELRRSEESIQLMEDVVESEKEDAIQAIHEAELEEAFDFMIKEQLKNYMEY